jgi:hypothetical protein
MFLSSGLFSQVEDMSNIKAISAKSKPALAIGSASRGSSSKQLLIASRPLTVTAEGHLETEYLNLSVRTS